MGNSHIAALKGGWEKGEARTDLLPDFYGALSNGMESLSLIDGKLLPQDVKAAEFYCQISGKETGVVPDHYDAFLLCGMGMFPITAFSNYNSFSTPSTRNTKAPHYVSDACLDDLVWDQIDRSMMMHCARLVRSVTEAPVFLVWQAFWSEALFNIEWRAKQMGPILENRDQNYILERMQYIEMRLEKEGFAFLHQPVETIEQGIMTKAKYSRGSVQLRDRLNQSHHEHDVFHMNSDYGVQCWKAWTI